MRRALLASAAVVGLIVATPALAYHGQGPDNGNAQAGAWNSSHNGNPPAGGTNAGGADSGGGHHHDHSGSSNNTSNGSGDEHHHDHSGGSNAAAVGTWNGGSGAWNSGHDHRSHDSHGVWTDHNNHDGNAGWRGWHNGHNDNWDSYRRAWSSPQRYHWGSYHRPSGWYYRRWAIGAFLPALFYTHNYWINDYAEFDLGAPPPGTVWVRYGSDALLIDEYSGEVVQVVYGVFY